MTGVCSVKLCRNDGEAVVTACGEEYRITIADLEALGLEDGGAVDDEGLQTLSECAEKLSCIKKSFVYLSYRALPALKLRQKLKTAGFSEDAIDKTIRLLTKKGYLNDEELCLDYAVALRDGKKFGASRLRKELYAKGFSRECVDSAVEEAFEDYETEEAILSVLSRKFLSLEAEDRQARAKAVAYLYRMGYSYDDINNAIEAFGRE